jgi:hypothetical protein
MMTVPQFKGITSAQQYLRIHAPDFRLLFDGGTCEFIVKKYGLTKDDPSTYFTNDLNDAVRTALDMQHDMMHAAHAAQGLRTWEDLA